jgi:uncharacterized protein YdeI (YjbR/CyaY-like superfamily)
VAGYERIHPATRDEWRTWLEAQHDSSPGVWVVQWRSSTGRPRVAYEDLIEEALCFGWVDGRANKVDDDRSMIMMTPRRPTSTWARSNKERVERLVAEGRMTDAGRRAIDTAKANGSWSILDDVDALIVPDDLRSALSSDPVAQGYFDGFPPSAKKQILYWIKSAKRPETRQRRIAETVRLAAHNLRAARPTA